ncbi:PAS domain S-box protein [Kovacikia minuta CCNUW1]|uniref:PAS domain S-box protein n=1 Tax=Kovacikia minuta TaxID=2931930 RepID=UPI001CCFAF65|nr:PAS domain S-box protein [Kovacikia minuta]UBF28470.1 PAS domain S-box protein [Kovacikia minuta CCNUW1]
MRPEYLEGLRECCQSEAAFERMQQILLMAETEQRQVELNALRQSLMGEQVRQTVIAAEPEAYQDSLKNLIAERTNDLLNTNKRLRQEIADRKWAEQALQESEQRFRSLIENAIDIIAILDEKGIFRYCSPSTERVLGYKIKEVVGRPATDFVHPEDTALILKVLQEAIQHPQISQPSAEYRVRHRNGSWCSFEAVATSLLDDSAIRGVVINCHDITERKQAEGALLSANRQIVNILESITDAFMSLDTQWRFTYLNQRAAQIFQRSQEELLGQQLWEAFPEVRGSTFERQYYQAIEKQESITFEEFYPSLNTWFEVRVFPSFEGLSIFLLDITERRESQAELLEMSTALGNAVEGIARLDTSSRYIALNRAYASALGYQQQEMMGMSWHLTFHPEDISTLETAYQLMLTEGKAEAEVRMLRKDGSAIYHEVVMVAAYDWHDRLIGHHCFTKDITERKQAEETLRQQAERERLMSAIARRIRNSLDVEEILDTTALEVRQFLRAERVVIYRIEPNGDGLVTAESVEAKWTSLMGFRLQEDWFKQRQKDYRQGKNLVIDDAQQIPDAQACQKFLNNAQIVALLVVPILHGNQLWGLVGVHQCSKARHWEPLEISLLEQLATQVAIAIQQSELYRQVQQLNTKLEVQVQERTAQLQQALQFEAMLKRITDSVRDSLDEEKILQTAVQELALGLNVFACDAALYDTERRIAVICYEYIRSDLPPAKGTTVHMSHLLEIHEQLLQEWCFQFCQIAPEPVRPIQNKFAVLSCPMVNDQGVMGDLWLFRPCESEFNNLEIRVVQQVANQCAIAIRQARLYQAAQAQVAALEELNQLKDDFLSTVSHELRTPMSNMKMAIHMLRNVTSPERQERYLEILQAECIREIELINDLLDLQRLEASSYPVSPEAIHLKPFLLETIEPFRSRANDRQQILTIHLTDNLPSLETDKAALERILAELLNNACKYTPPGNEVALTAHSSQEDLASGSLQVVLRVSNQAEIPATELPRIFEKFYRVPNADPWKQGGTGLGLALVQRLVLQLQGKIQVESQNGWTIFTVFLPLPHQPI